MKISHLMILLAPTLASLAPAHPGHAPAQPPWQEATAWPDRIIATLAGDPAHSFAVSWRTDISVAPAVAQIAEASSDTRFDLSAKTVNGTTTSMELAEVEGPEGDELEILENAGLPAVHYHSVNFTKLQPDTLYAYRVRGEQGKWSPWRQLRTAPLDGPVEFLFFGDAQNGVRSHVTRLFDTAAQVAPRARFAIHGGDLVNTAMYDKEWAEWFGALGRTHVTIPALPVAGNHDYVNFAKAGMDEDDDSKLFMMTNKAVTPLWRPQFALPVEDTLPVGLQETVYDIRYSKDVHVFVLDSSGNAWNEQLAWLGGKLEASEARWKIVTMHHPLYSFVGGREHPSAQERRIALLATMRDHDIDIILTGHRHTYQRGAYGDDVARFGVGEPHAFKTMFVVTASTTKRGETKADGWDRYSQAQAGAFKLDRRGDNAPIFAVLNASPESLRYRAFDAVGELYDEFTITKDAAGHKTVSNGAVAGTPEKTYDNTGRYIGWDDLR